MDEASWDHINNKNTVDFFSLFLGRRLQTLAIILWAWMILLNGTVTGMLVNQIGEKYEIIILNM